MSKSSHHPQLTVIRHPLVAHKLSLMREKDASTARFRQVARELGLLLGYEVLHDLPIELREIETPMGPMQAPFIKGKKMVLVPILRAALGLVDGLLDLVPSARVGHIGIYREPETLTAVEYFLKLPEDIEERPVVVVSAVVASGNTAIAAISRLKEHGARDVKLVTLVAAPAGLEALAASYPDVPVYTAAVDERLDARGYVIPGLGDAGDRMFGTK
jgi:uracil phosphoribosyltransferase